MQIDACGAGNDARDHLLREMVAEISPLQARFHDISSGYYRFARSLPLSSYFIRVERERTSVSNKRKSPPYLGAANGTNTSAFDLSKQSINFR